MDRPELDKFLAQTSPEPYGIHLEKSEGCYVWDKSNKRYLDFISGIAVANIGHRHPAVIDAVKNQLDKYLHTMVYGEYFQDVQMQLGEKLASVLPDSLNCSYLVNSGTEANEAALKLAKRHTGRSKIVAFNKSYHGSTHGSLSVSGNEEKKYAFRPLLPDVHFINFNQIEDLDIIDDKTACVIIEPIQGDAGVRIADKAFIHALRQKCNDCGALLIFDEIQVGMARTGKFFAFEHYDVVPDILTLAKSLGAGLPIGAMISNRALMRDFTHHPMLGHITTFGGNPLSCAAASAGIDVLSEIDMSEIQKKGEYLASNLKHPKVKDVRQIGLMLAVDLENDNEVSNLLEDCKANGLIIYRFLSNPHSFRISPPLTITEEQIQEGINILRDSLDRL